MIFNMPVRRLGRVSTVAITACLAISGVTQADVSFAQSVAETSRTVPAKRLLTVDDIIGLTDIQSVEISPDGRTIAYVTKAGIGQRATQSAIWIMPSDGSKPARRLTISASLDGAPSWSPDGRSIAFLSNRTDPSISGVAGFDLHPASAAKDIVAGSRQIWLIPLDGGEATPLTAAGRDIRSFQWSPDGRSIAYLAPEPLTPQARADRAARRDWNEADKGKDYNRLWIMDVTSRSSRAIAVADREISDMVWSPDGRHMSLRVAATAGLNDHFYRSGLVVVDVTGKGAERTIFSGVYSAGSWSPDGKHIAFIAPEEDMIGIRGFVAEVATGTLRSLGGRLDGTLKRFDWSKSGREIVTRAIVHDRGTLLMADAERDQFRSLIQFDGHIRDYSIADDESIAFVGSQGDRAADIWTFRNGNLRRLTDINPQMRDLRLGKVEAVQWTSSRDGTPVHGILVTPPDLPAGVPTKTVVQPHGGPQGIWTASWQGSWTDWAQLLAARGYVVLLPNPRGSEGQGTEFSRGVKNAWGSGDYQDIVDGVDMLVKRGITDPARMAIGGWSYGGFMSAYAITHDNRFKTAIVGAGVTDMVNLSLSTDTPDWFAGYYGLPPYGFANMEKTSPIRAVDRANGPVLVLHGQEDRRVPVTQGIAFYRGLKMLGKQSTLVTYPREPHWIQEPEHQRDVLQRVIDWLDTYL